MDTPLIHLLHAYRDSLRERWHTPGHKGIVPPGGDFLDWDYDVTEITPLLTEDPNALRQSEDLMAQSYGVKRTWYSVQGATLPVMAAILAANPPGSTLYVDRALHRSVVGALMMGGYDVRWVYPPLLKAGLMLPVTDWPSLAEGASGFVLTRPTYDGLAQNLRPILTEARRRHLSVVVDEAHGSHFGGAHFPESALQMGADLVAHGSHKTEATLTQTGLLHQNSERILSGQVDYWWRMLSTSSPSYLLLASLDRLQWERRQPSYGEHWDTFAVRTRRLWHKMEERGLRILQPWAERQGYQADPARLTLLGSGTEISERLSALGEIEKVTPGSCTLILSPDQDISRLEAALYSMDWPTQAGELLMIPYPRLPRAMTIRETWSRSGRRIPLEDSVGSALKEALTPYPPGIPFALPGECMTQNMVEWLREWEQTVSGSIEGVYRAEGRRWVWAIDR